MGGLAEVGARANRGAGKARSWVSRVAPLSESIFPQGRRSTRQETPDKNRTRLWCGMLCPLRSPGTLHARTVKLDLNTGYPACEVRLMIIGVFADTHDHLENIRRCVAHFNQRRCDLVVFAGDLVSTFAVPPLRELSCPLVASFGDNEGNKIGIRGGMEIIGEIHDPPFGYCAADGTRLLITHQLELLRHDYAGSDVVIFAHTHRPLIRRDGQGRLFLNPGEAIGWTYGQATVAQLDTVSMQAEIVELG